ncbi:MAG: glycosyltransferase [Hafnia sp.]
MEKELISVCVVSYNSESTILETLESILAQTYGSEYIELLISDDASIDNTVNLIEEWICAHKSKFESVIFIKHEHNIGITKNCNSLWRLATQSWIKSIAGDDILMPTCLKKNVDFMHDNNIESVIFSKMRAFNRSSDGSYHNLEEYPSIFQQKFLESDRASQYHYLINAGGLPVAPTSFINRELLAKVGFADERFPMIEDYPLWIKIIESGQKFYFLNEITVKYRKGDSVSQSTSLLFNVRHFLQHLTIELMLTNNKISLVTKIRKYIYTMAVLCVYVFFDAKPSILSKFVYRIGLFVKPYWLADKLSKK